MFPDVHVLEAVNDNKRQVIDCLAQVVQRMSKLAAISSQEQDTVYTDRNTLNACDFQ